MAAAFIAARKSRSVSSTASNVGDADITSVGDGGPEEPEPDRVRLMRRPAAPAAAAALRRVPSFTADWTPRTVEMCIGRCRYTTEAMDQKRERTRSGMDTWRVSIPSTATRISFVMNRETTWCRGCGGRGEGRGDWNPKEFVHQTWPKSIFLFVEFILSGPRGGGVPPLPRMAVQRLCMRT